MYVSFSRAIAIAAAFVTFQLPAPARCWLKLIFIVLKLSIIVNLGTFVGFVEGGGGQGAQER